MSKEYTYACFGGQAFQGQTRNLNQSHLRRGKQGWGREKALNLSVSAPLTNCNVATCWHVELSMLNLLLLWLNVYLSFNSSIHVFHSKIDENSLGLTLHASWGVACATTEKNDVQCLPSLPLPVSAGRLSYRQTYIKQVAEKHCCLRSIHMPVLAGRLSKGKPAISINLTFGVENKDEVGKRLWICLSLHRWQTAMWPHVGTLNSARSTFSSFDSTFTWAIASILLSTSFIRK